MDETIDDVVAGFGRLTGFGLSTLRAFARLFVVNINGTADTPLIFGSAAFPATVAVVVVVAAVDVATELLNVLFAVDVLLFSVDFSSAFDVMLNMCFSSFVMVMLFDERMLFGALYDNEVMAANGFGGGWSVVCGDD